MTGIKKREIADFAQADREVLNIFRTVLLFGKNVSTYKFALCHALMKQRPKSELKYVEVRDTFLEEMLRHYKLNSSQYTGGENSITKAFGTYLGSAKSAADWDSLMAVAERNIYNNVFDAFQNIGDGTLDRQYQLFEHDRKGKKIVLTDNLNSLLERPAVIALVDAENQARWRVVEEAWKNKLSPNLLEYNEADGLLYSVNLTGMERVNLRSAVNTLLPYQHGRCFYCGKKVRVDARKEEHDFPDVDHFLPFSMLIRNDIGLVNPNGIWNLVIACKECNRGSFGKFDAPPNAAFYEKLKRRNVLFVEEHRHSLKNSILISLHVSGASGVSTRMQQLHGIFKYLKGWEPKFYYS